MATNNRVYFAIHAVALSKEGIDFAATPTGYIAAHGCQSIGQEVSFNVEPVNEIGQIENYELVENIPNVTMTIEKVIDGYPLIQHLASQSPAASTLNGRYNNARANVIAAIYNEAYSAASGTPLSIAFLSGMYVSDISFNIPVQGNITESVTLVGNNRVWYTGSALGTAGTPIITTGLYKVDSRFNNADTPPGTGGIQRRENVIMANSLFPTQIPGISALGVNSATAGIYSAHIQSINISVSLNRTELFELGRRGPYHRFAEFPTNVTTSIEVTTNEFGDTVSAYEEQDNLTDSAIKIALSCGVTIDLGTKNKLTGISRSGGDTAGGNMTSTYNFFNQNTLTVTFPGSDFT